jgi:hypothetical protein
MYVDASFYIKTIYKHETYCCRKRFLVTIATKCEELSLCMKVSYVIVDKDGTSLFSMRPVCTVSIDSI